MNSFILELLTLKCATTSDSFERTITSSIVMLDQLNVLSMVEAFCAFEIAMWTNFSTVHSLQCCDDDDNWLVRVKRVTGKQLLAKRDEERTEKTMHQHQKSCDWIMCNYLGGLRKDSLRPQNWLRTIRTCKRLKENFTNFRFSSISPRAIGRKAICRERKGKTSQETCRCLRRLKRFKCAVRSTLLHSCSSCFSNLITCFKSFSYYKICFIINFKWRLFRVLATLSPVLCI